MEILWSPWRSKYIESFSENNENPSCFVCDAIHNPIEEKERLVVFRTKCSIVLLNKYPYNSGHLLICPIKHVPMLDELKDDELLDLIKVVRLAINYLGEVLRPQGYNVGINIGRVAGAGLPEHIHFHVVPRWNGDTSFISVISDTKVISQSMEELYRKLYSIFNKT